MGDCLVIDLIGGFFVNEVWKNIGYIKIVPHDLLNQCLCGGEFVQ